ncbi:MAG: ribosome maturation factor RimP [Treponema sp.]|nr:MAG: ribosome maturation factor RimP [Treponema sp.]
MKRVQKNDSPHFEESKALIEGLGYKVVDYSLARLKTGWKVSVVIFSENGVGIDDCVNVHRTLKQRLEVLLDSQDVDMEVSSPGVKRVIKKTSEFEAFVGQEVSVWDLSCTDWVEGCLTESSDSGVTLDKAGSKVFIPFENVKKAKLSK